MSAPGQQQQAPDAAHPVPLPLSMPSPLLVDHEQLAQLNSRLHQFPQAAVLDEVFAWVQQYTPLLQAVVDASLQALRGRPDGQPRLALLLNNMPSRPPRLQHGHLAALLAQDPDAPPRLLNAELLLALASATARSHPCGEEDGSAPIDRGLAQLLEPWAVLEVMSLALDLAEKGHPGALTTLATGWQAQALHTRLLGAEGNVPVRAPSEPRPPVWRDWGLVWGCLVTQRRQMSMVDRLLPAYEIQSLSNPQACAGQLLVLRGRNFGPGGRVAFSAPGPDDPQFAFWAGNSALMIGADPVSWRDDEIQVQVPRWAVAGELHLNAFERREDRCATIDVYRNGNSVTFLGGLARVLQASLNGQPLDPAARQPVNLTPNDTVVVSWRSSDTPGTSVSIRLLDENGTLLLERTGLPGGTGSMPLTVPDVLPQRPRRASLVLSAVSPCGIGGDLKIPVILSVAPQLWVDWIEVTQGIQVEPGSPLGGIRAATVAGKDTAVRIHLRCQRGSGRWYDDLAHRLVGELWVDERYRLSALNNGLCNVAGSSRETDDQSTLNFTVPGAWLTPGEHRLRVRLVCPDLAGTIVREATLNWTFPAKAPLRIRCLWLGAYGQFAQETMLEKARQALDLLPTPLTAISIASRISFTHTHDLTNRAGLEALVDDLEDEYDDVDEDEGIRWLALLPEGTSLNSISGIAPTPGVIAIAPLNRPDIAAHELGHAVGLHHVNLGGPGGPFDTADNGGRLRRRPWDVRVAKSVPLPAGDLMGYLEPIRPGITTWTRLVRINF